MKKSAVMLLVAGVMIAVLAGCAKKEETPAERAAKQFDKGLKSLGKGVEKAGGKIQDAAKGKNE